MLKRIASRPSSLMSHCLIVLTNFAPGRIPEMNMDHITIRTEREADYDAIRNLVSESFSSASHTDGDEHNHIDRLRETDEYLPELSLVAVAGGRIVGHVMMSRINVGGQIALALAPLAVLPEYQGRGIGSLLVEEAHRLALAQGYGLSVLLGHPGYYSRFGYTPASRFGIKAPFDVPDEYFMVCPLAAHHPLPSGLVEYSQAFRL